VTSNTIARFASIGQHVAEVVEEVSARHRHPRRPLPAGLPHPGRPAGVTRGGPVPAPVASDPVDRVDDQDRPMGTVPRGKVHELGANFRTAHIFVTDDRRLLMLQRVGPAHRHRGLLGSSAAGYLHAGESYEAGARRRLAEEVDLHGPLVDVGKVAVPDRGVIKFVRLFWSPLAGALPRIVDRAHVAGLEFHDVGDVEQRLAAEPEAFTPTFARVFGLFFVEQP